MAAILSRPQCVKSVHVKCGRVTCMLPFWFTSLTTKHIYEALRRLLWCLDVTAADPSNIGGWDRTPVILKKRGNRTEISLIWYFKRYSQNCWLKNMVLKFSALSAVEMLPIQLSNLKRHVAYRQTSNTSRTKSENLDVSCLILQICFAQSTEARC